ncbi:MAG: L,D-transpeptidase, partial [Haliscomenobacter sp.]|nr:L,D-transpeptidase [Haliscomenobacter sp.]
YEVTRRDDGLLTACPQIPWLEPEINGQRLGHLIHPTTNPRTLGRAYSNGCIGTREGDAWFVYYHAPLGTRVVFRYDLWTVGPEGDTVRLRNVYRR